MGFIGTKLNDKRKITICKCVVCGREFESNLTNAKYCSNDCRRVAIRKRYLDARVKKLLEEGVEGIDYVIDKWNSLPTPRIYGQWMKSMHPGKTVEDYKNEFPGAPIYCQRDYEHLTANGGRHMKTEKYKKMFSERFKGENNPRHHSKISEQEIRENSPYCEEFYIKRGIDPDERLKVVEKSNKNRVSVTSLQYYLNKGLSMEDAIAAQKERNRTFTLEKCIERHGVEEGTRIYNERQMKWSEKIEQMYKDGKFSKMPKDLLAHTYSKAELNFVEELCKYCNIDIDDVFCAKSKKKQYILRGEKQPIYSYDFCKGNKIIEFNGDFWHANPQIYKADDYINRGRTAKEIWEKDLDKRLTAEKAGFDVMVVWESEFNANTNDVLEKCKSFLND